jgi:hypothetical protein
MTEGQLQQLQFGPSQQEAALNLIESMPWGDTGPAIADLESTLKRALEATDGDFARWENDLGPRFEQAGFDEFTLPPGLIEDMTTDQRLAYVARLLTSLTFAYAGACDPEGEVDDGSPAALLRGLDALSLEGAKARS